MAEEAQISRSEFAVLTVTKAKLPQLFELCRQVMDRLQRAGHGRQGSSSPPQPMRLIPGISYLPVKAQRKSAGGERLSASKLTRAVARPSKADPDDSDGDDDSIGPLSAPVPGIHRRTACDISQSTVRSDLRRSQSAQEPGTHSGLRATPRERCSTSSSEGTPDEPLRVYYKSVKQCHRGKKAIISEAVDKTSKRPVIIKAFLKQGMTQVKREKMLRENAMLKAANGVAGVVRLLNVLDDTQYEYHVLEYVPGESASCTYNICVVHMPPG
ncbi:protein kinase domain-containing protein [Haematococcus lacustris]|uniref:Protein kinase domain-containing protein n=1 Tax=Haematococcus lacustris TaxID=44745 RepID=A0A699YTR4_HAELA|nr:protein kinase domain-containing protein [Haematococcus lacustris]